MPARKKKHQPVEHTHSREHDADVKNAAAAVDAKYEQPKERKARQVGPATQKVIDRILDMRRAGMGLPTIAKTLNDEKVPTFGSGKTWYPPVVRGICLRHGVERGEKVEQS